MRIYNYFLYSIYTQLMNPRNKNDERTAIIITTVVTSLFFYILVLIIITIIELYFFNISIFLKQSKLIYIFCMAILSFLNYSCFIKEKNFLDKNFKTDKLGGYLILFLILLNGFCFIHFANKNREKIFNEREKARIGVMKN